MQINLKQNGMLARLWQSTYNKNLPQSLCSYFWTTILAILLAIPAWPGHIINALTKRTYDRIQAFWFSLHLPLLYIIGISLLTDKGQPVASGFLAAYGAGWVLMLILAAGLGICLAIIALVQHLIEKYKDHRDKKLYEAGVINEYGYRIKPEEKKPNIVLEYWKAFIGKYCPKINWK